MNMVNAADSPGRRKARSCSAHELRDVLRAQRRRGAIGKRKEMVVGRPKNADLSWRAERAANNRQRCGDVRASGEPLGRAACTVSWTQTPTVVRRLVVRCGRSTRIDDRRRGMPGMPMHRRACVATGHRRRNTIVLGTRVDDPVPQEHRDQPQLDHGCQRSEPTRASHWYESMSCPARRHCPRYTAAIPGPHICVAGGHVAPNANAAPHDRPPDVPNADGSDASGNSANRHRRRRLSDRCCGRAGRRLALIQSDTRAERVDKFRTTLGPAELRAGPFAFRRDSPRRGPPS